MKKLVLLLFLCFGWATMASAATYTFTAPDRDIMDLEHQRFYAWGINDFTLASDEYITGASLTFYNIYNWESEDDRLYIHLLDSVPDSATLGTPIDVVMGPESKDAIWDWPDLEQKYYMSTLYRGTDNQNPTDAFALLGTLITPTWSDPDDDLTSNTLIYDFAHLNVDLPSSIAANGDIIPGNINILSILESYMTDGLWAFGFDPDCHY